MTDKNYDPRYTPIKSTQLLIDESEEQIRRLNESETKIRRILGDRPEIEIKD